jgi:hypothetical protein
MVATSGLPAQNPYTQSFAVGTRSAVQTPDAAAQRTQTERAVQATHHSDKSLSNGADGGQPDSSQPRGSLVNMVV